MTNSGSGLPQEDFAYVIVILAAAVHLILIITIIICSCCKHKCTCLDVTYERPTQRNDTLSQQIDRLPDYNESEAQANTANQTLVSSENRTVTSWRTSLLMRVQSRMGLVRPRDPPSEDPPAYGSHDFAEGHTNPVCSEDLPPYQEHVRHLPPWYVAMETGSEDKPPLYEEVVNQKNT